MKSKSPFCLGADPTVFLYGSLPPNVGKLRQRRRNRSTTEQGSRRFVLTECSHRVFSPSVLTECSHRVFAPSVRTECSHRVFAPSVRTDAEFLTLLTYSFPSLVSPSPNRKLSSPMPPVRNETFPPLAETCSGRCLETFRSATRKTPTSTKPSKC
jgi:hypothetical protein